MSTIKVNSIKNTATNDGGIAIDNSGHVQIENVQLPSAGPLSNRNLVIGGAMNIAQRGTSVSVTDDGDDDYLVDRFFARMVGSAVATYSQSTDSPADFTHSSKLDVTTADTDLSTGGQFKIEHRVEGFNSAFLKWGTSDAKTVTLSFWIRSNLTGNTQVAFVNFDNNRNYVATFTIDSADTWEKKTLTVSGDTSGTWRTDSEIGIRLRWGSFGTSFQTSSTNQWVGNSTQLNSRSDSPINFASSTDNELYLTGVQLEVGSVATPFEHRSVGDELIRCQRYYEKSYDLGVAPGTANEDGMFHWQSNGASAAIASFPARFTVRKRAEPTVVVYNPTTGSSGSLRCNNGTNQAAQSYGVGQTGFNFRTTAGATTNNRYVGHYTAEAEL